MVSRWSCNFIISSRLRVRTRSSCSGFKLEDSFAVCCLFRWLGAWIKRCAVKPQNATMKWSRWDFDEVQVLTFQTNLKGVQLLRLQYFSWFNAKWSLKYSLDGTIEMRLFSSQSQGHKVLNCSVLSVTNPWHNSWTTKVSWLVFFTVWEVQAASAGCYSCIGKIEALTGNSLCLISNHLTSRFIWIHPVVSALHCHPKPESNVSISPKHHQLQLIHSAILNTPHQPDRFTSFFSILFHYIT